MEELGTAYIEMTRGVVVVGKTAVHQMDVSDEAWYEYDDFGIAIMSAAVVSTETEDAIGAVVVVRDGVTRVFTADVLAEHADKFNMRAERVVSA